MGGDKIVLLDGAGANGGGAATNGLLSMIPGMFANLIGGNKMDPNLVAALKSANVVMKWRTGNTGGWVTNPTRPITMETTDTTVTDLRCVEVADVAEVVLIEEQTQRIQLIRNM